MSGENAAIAAGSKSMDELILFLSSAVVVGVPILYATIGEILSEKSGNLNLGVEGMMLVGAVIGFKIGYATGNPFLAAAGAGAAGAAAAFLYGFFTISLRCNQIITGLTLTIFGTGFANFLGGPYIGERLPASVTGVFHAIPIPLLSRIPFAGPILFNQNILVYIAYLLAAAAAVYLYYTRGGLRLRLVGENPEAADALGIQVSAIKYAHVLLSGLLSGIGGAYICFASIPTWQNNIVAGKGWIAVALVIFSGWNPALALPGTLLFGLLSILGIRLQKYNLPVSQYFFDMLPYLMTIVVLYIGSFRRSKSAEPASLGNSWFRETR